MIRHKAAEISWEMRVIGVNSLCRVHANINFVMILQCMQHKPEIWAEVNYKVTSSQTTFHLKQSCSSKILLRDRTITVPMILGNISGSRAKQAVKNIEEPIPSVTLNNIQKKINIQPEGICGEDINLEYNITSECDVCSVCV